MPIENGALRASRTHRSSPLIIGILAALLAVGGLAAHPEPVAAAAPKVVIVVGPTHGLTSSMISTARELASQARSYGARVVEVYSPYATWARVKYFAQGANLFVYLGHGNGYPSPYGGFRSTTMDGMGLNAEYGRGHYNTKYYGEYYMPQLRLAANSVVLLNRLCYASGAGEPGMAAPSLSVARQRVDNFAAGFLRSGARAVFAESYFTPKFVLHGLFKTNRTVSQIFWSAPNATKTYATSFASSRTSGKRAILDPYKSYNNYRRSVVGDMGMTAATWR